MTPPNDYEDPYANKAAIAAVVFIVSVILQYVTSKGFSLEQEGVTALAGAITTVLVYGVSNRHKLFSGNRSGHAVR